MPAVIPTRRTALAIAAVALTALVLPVWLLTAAVLVVLAAAALDAWDVREPPMIERTVQRVLSRGVAAPLRVGTLCTDRRTVLLRQPGGDGVEIRASSDGGTLVGSVVAQRRGRRRLAGVASASVGPLGLARVHHRSGPDELVRVYPDLVRAVGLIARLRARTITGRAARSARGTIGLGTDFDSVRDYSPDDDIRQLNWRATARVGRPMSNSYRIERDRDLVCMLDAGRLMAAPVGRGTMLDAAVDAVTVLALACDELGDRCGAIAFDDRIRAAMAPQHRSGRRVIESLLDFEARAVDSDFELAFQRVGRARRAFVVVFTDLIDEAAARSLLAGIPMLARRHAVAVASAWDSELLRLATRAPRTRLEAAELLVARDVLRTRAATAQRLRRAGAIVIEAPAGQLPSSCLDAYLAAKSRARL